MVDWSTAGLHACIMDGVCWIELRSSLRAAMSSDAPIPPRSFVAQQDIYSRLVTLPPHSYARSIVTQLVEAEAQFHTWTSVLSAIVFPFASKLGQPKIMGVNMCHEKFKTALNLL